MSLRSPGRMVRLLLVLAGVLLAGGAAWALWAAFGPDPSCGSPGVSKHGPHHECVGVTDGSYVWSADQKQVFARIQHQNEIAARHTHVTLALFLPFTSTNPDVRLRTLHEVQGAYLAQYRANHRDDGAGPPVRLVLADPGVDSAEWRPVVRQLRTMAESPKDNLRAVVGIADSVTNNERAVRWLTDTAHIPVVGGAMTGDDIANDAAHPQRFKGLARVAPTNHDEAAALASFEKQARASDSLVVEDLRTDDDYIATLRTAFEKHAAHAPLAPEQFRSPANVNSEGTTVTDFRRMVPTICTSRAKVIYFAGRQVQLRQFINELGRRGCQSKHYTIVTGDVASVVSEDTKLDWGALRGPNRITLYYASLGSPDAWTGPKAPATGGSKAAYEALASLAAASGKAPIGPIGSSRGDLDLSDHQAIITHDSVWTAVTAIRAIPAGKGRVPTLGEIADGWLRMHGDGKVEGASGWICLDNEGNPYDKAVSVVRLDPATKGPLFVGLAWPTGRPPAQDCTAPNSPGHG
jgi:ABC-type branched-subunit amino acid transport system substrate-binding protein